MSRPQPLHGGIDMAHALRYARSIGCTVTRMGNQDLRVTHPSSARPCTLTAHGRKDCPRHLTVWLRRIAASQQTGR